MAVRTLSEAIDNLYTTTWYNMKSKAVDNIFDGSPFWFWLRASGGMEKAAGGRFIDEPLRYASSDNIKWITRGGTTDLTDKEFLTTAQYEWTYLTDTIVRFGVDEQQNRGKNLIMSLMKAKIENSKDSLANEMETRLAGAAGTNQMNGLQDIVADAGTGTVGGINSSTYTWWQNYDRTMTGVSFAASGEAYMLTALLTTSKGLKQEMADIIVTGQTVYEYYEIAVTAYREVVNKTLGDALFEHVVFKGKPIIWSPAIGTRMYFLQTKYMKYRYDPMMFFDMTRWKEIPNQVEDRAAQIITAGNLTTSRRRALGVIHTIDTA
jgi:hypothetical protein